jgi:hypothetical protein
MKSKDKIKALNEVSAFVVNAESRLKKGVLIYFDYNTGTERIKFYILETFFLLSRQVIDSYNIDLSDLWALSYKEFEFKLKEIITDIEKKYLTK